jgi:toluene monooxygenase electron transfer component
MRITLHTKSGLHELDCEGDERLLFAGLRQGLSLPYECATGTCGTCRGRVRDPKLVEDLWPAASGAAKLRRDKGDVLLCQARALGACEIAVPSEIVRLPESSSRPAWRKGRLVAPHRLTHDVMAFAVEMDGPMTFEAGQFVVVEVPGVRGFRAYSMVNYEPGTRRLELVVKRKLGGGFSDWLFSEASAEASVTIFGPLGKAVFRPAEGRDVLCIAGGSGIAGMMAILAHATREGYFIGRRGDVYFGVRTMRDVFYADELDAFAAAAGGGLAVTIALSDEDPPADGAARGRLAFARGFVHQVAAAGMAGRYANAVAFVAGPAPMVDGALKSLVSEARLPPQFIRYDKFS